MGIMGQLPSRPDELPGREVSSGEPPFDHGGPRADELPALGVAGSRTISLSAVADTSQRSAAVDEEAADGESDAGETAGDGATDDEAARP